MLQAGACFTGAVHGVLGNFKRSHWNLMQIKAECFAWLV
jgi:hypothetical protein